MGRKVHPQGFRLGIIKEHKSRWYADGQTYTAQTVEDREIREMVRNDLPKAGISGIEIERQPNQIHVIIDTARPGVIIGRKGASVNALRAKLQDMTQKKVKIDVREIARPELDARLVAESVAEQLERRISWKRAMKQAVQKTMRAGGQGIMITVAGGWAAARWGAGHGARRPDAAYAARDIDYGTARANTTFWRDRREGVGLPGRGHAGEEYHARYSVEAG